MAELKLEWRDAEAFSEAYAGPLYLLSGQGEWELYGSHEDGVLVARGAAVSRDESKLAAEAAALAWLTEGVTALGARVIDANTVVRLRAALKLFSHMPHTFAEEVAACEELARKLEAGNG